MTLLISAGACVIGLGVLMGRLTRILVYVVRKFELVKKSQRMFLPGMWEA